MSLFLFGISIGEIVLIFVVVLMLFGSKSIPGLARSLGKGMNEFRKAADDIKREFEQSTSEIKEELTEIEENIRQNSNDIRDMAQDVYRDDYGSSPDTSADVYGLDKPEVSAEDNQVSPEKISDNDKDTSQPEPDSPKNN